MGQSDDVISPLNPATLNYSVRWSGGNIGFRRTQFRAERFLSLSESTLLTLQTSLSQDIVTDFPADPGVRREASDWPVVQARAAVSFDQPHSGARPVEIGFSGHVGETGFDFLAPGPPPLDLPPEDDQRFKTWSFNIDLHLPITERLGVHGEFFTGAYLSSFLCGIGQGVCPCLRVPIRATGGWGEAWYYWTPRLHSHTGYGVDDPNDNDSLIGRTYNQFIFTNLVLDVSERFTTGLEVTYWKTLYHDTRVGQVPPSELTPFEPGKAILIDWMIRYDF